MATLTSWMGYLGDFAAGATVSIFFSTNDGAGGAVAPSTAFEAADVKIFKGTSDTERTGVSGVTMTSPFNATVGLHTISIDLSDDDDAGFYAAANDYTVVLDPSDETVDTQTVVKPLAQFSIENRFNELPNGSITPATFAAGAIDNAAIAAGAITQAELVIDDTEPADAADAVSSFWERLKYLARSGVGTNTVDFDGTVIQTYNDAAGAALIKHTTTELAGTQTRNAVDDA